MYVCKCTDCRYTVTRRIDIRRSKQQSSMNTTKRQMASRANNQSVLETPLEEEPRIEDGSELPATNGHLPTEKLD